MKKTNRAIWFSSYSPILQHLIRIVAVCAALLSVAAYGSTLTWSGGGANANWNNSVNWGGSTPGNGDTLVFPAGAARLLNTNNIASLTLKQIRFTGAGGGYDLRGNVFTLTNSILATNTSGANTIENYITLATSDVLIVVSNGVSLTLDGNLSGSVGVTKAGLGTLIYQGPADNTYNGTTLVSGGTLQLNVGGYNAFGGPLVIGDGTGAGSPTVQNLQWEEISAAVPITINQNGTLDLNNHSETIGPSLTLSGGTIQTGSGMLTLSPNSTITTTNGDSYIYGNLNTGSGTLTLQGNDYHWLIFEAIVSGSANIVQNDTLTTGWDSANTYTGNYTANGSGGVFLENSLALGNINNSMTLNGYAYVAVYSNINITNQSLTINDSGEIYVPTPSTNSWRANFTLGSAGWVDVLTNCALNLNGPIGGAGGFTKFGPGTLILSGSSANTYGGLTTVNEGELDLNKTGAPAIAIPSYGPGLVIGNGIGTDTVRCLNNHQIWSIVTPVTINKFGVLDLNGHVDEAAPLSLNGGSITTGSAGQFGLFGTVTVLSAATATISGNVFLDSGVVINNYSGAYLYISASISGSYGITLAGAAGSVFLQSSNSYTGLTIVQQGWLRADNPWALGSTNAGTIVSSGASLVLDGIGITNEALTLNGPGYSSVWGALDVEYGNNTWAGPITNNANSTLDSWDPAAALHILGPISGAGGLELFGYGTHYFDGFTANTYVGVTKVDAGTTLLLNKSVFNVTIPHNLDIFGTVRYVRPDQIADAADVNIESGGLLDFSTQYDSFDTLHGNGRVTFGTGGYLDIGGNNGTSIFNGLMSGIGYVGGYTVGKDGAGTFTMNGNNTYQNGSDVFGGTLIINGNQPQSPVLYMDASATLGGSGTVGTIAADGIISPGSSPGILNSSDVTFSSTGTFTVELTGPNPGSGYDQLNVAGAVNLNNATLTVVPAFTTPVSIGQQFVIINNDGADVITNTFNGLPNGAQFSTGGYFFRINYNGGSGNDVVLTLLGVPDKTVTLNAVVSGWYNSTGFHDPSNPNYLAGEGSIGTDIYRNWFVFNAPVSGNSIIHAELIINCYWNISPHGQETYLVRKVTTPIATLEAGGSGLVGIYNDLGTGAVYSVRCIATNESNQRAIIPLNVTFMKDATAVGGGQIALGGSIATLDATDNNQYLFGGSLAYPTDIQLRLTYGTNLLINSSDRGRYNSLGDHSTYSYNNYYVGREGGELSHNYFVFNLPALLSQLVDAELLLNSYTNTSPSGFETYQLYDVTNSITVLTNEASGATNVYADLGSGAGYGGRNVYVSESGTMLSLPLNGSFLGAAQTNSGGRIALGGALTSLNPVPTTEGLFGYSTFSLPADAQLWLGILAAPSSHPSFVGTPTCLGNDQFQFTVSGASGTTNEIQGSFDFQNWDFIRDLVMTNSTTSFLYTNDTVVPYRFLRAEQLQ